MRAIVSNPEALESAYHETMVELMSELALGTLEGEARALAQRLHDTDAEARELYRLFSTLPRPASPPPLDASETVVAALSSLIDELRGYYRSLVPLPHSALAAGGQLRSEKKTMSVGGLKATLSLNERPNGDLDADLSIPVASITDPAALEGLLLRVVDKPQLLKFVMTDEHYVANLPLPRMIADPGKDLELERVELA